MSKPNNRSKELKRIHKIIDDIESLIKRYRTSYEQQDLSIFTKCANNLSHDEKQQLNKFTDSLKGIYKDISSILQEEKIQSIQYVLEDDQIMIESLTAYIQEIEHRLKLTDSDDVLSKIESEQEKHPNSALQQENENLKKQILEQQQIIASFQQKNDHQSQNQGEEKDYKSKYIKLYNEYDNICKEVQPLFEENESLRQILQDYEKQKPSHEDHSQKEELMRSNKRVKELIDETEVLKKSLQVREQKYLQKIDDLNEQFANAAKQYDQLFEEKESIKEIATNQDQEIQQLVKEKETLQNKYDELQEKFTINSQQFDELQESFNNGRQEFKEI